MNVERASQSAPPSSSRASQSAPSPSSVGLFAFDSVLVKDLLLDWTWGRLSAVRVQEIAYSSYKDQVALLTRLGLSPDLACESLLAVAKLGSWGKNPNHCHSQLISWLGVSSLPPPLVTSIPLVIPKAGPNVPSEQERNFPSLLPHVNFAHYFANDKARFDELFLGNCKTLQTRESFWNELEARGDPRLRGHPMCKRRGWKTNMIPLASHGDGVPVLQVGKLHPKSVEVS